MSSAASSRSPSRPSREDLDNSLSGSPIRGPALIHSSASLGQLSFGSNSGPLPNSPSFGSLSFAGTLAGSKTYERRADRLPPVDPDYLEVAAERKLVADAKELRQT